MSDELSLQEFGSATASPGASHDEVLVRFPPGLGLIPPREVQRPRRGYGPGAA